MHFCSARFTPVSLSWQILLKIMAPFILLAACAFCWEVWMNFAVVLFSSGDVVVK
jgi:hypothetical protein